MPTDQTPTQPERAAGITDDEDLAVDAVHAAGGRDHVFVVVTNDNRFVGVYATEERAADEATQRGYYLREELPDA